MTTTRTAALTIGLALLVPLATRNQASYRTLTIDTTEVTAPGVSVAPDGAVAFSGLGHLYLVPAQGGAAVQLTTGPSYDFDPAVSPDGRRVAFASNRDASGSNIFVLELATRRVTQLSRDVESARPTWSPDGRTIAYARTLAREEHSVDLMPGFADIGLREVRTVSADGGAPTVVGPPRTVEALFYLPDGRLGWTVTERNPGGGMFQSIKQTRVEARGADGAVAVLATVGGDPGRVVPSPAGDGVYFGARGNVQWLPFGPGSTPTPGPRIQDGTARVSLTRDGGAVIFGDRGQLWRAALPSGLPERIPFSASMRVDVRPRVRPTWRAPSSEPSAASFRAVMSPVLSPDGRRLVVMAGGFLWEQPVGGGPARRVSEGDAFLRDPAFSPDGRQLAFVANEHGSRELRVFDFASRQTRSIFRVGGASWPLYPSWSPDGTQIVFQHTRGIFDPYRILVVGSTGGAPQEIAQSIGAWTARPHFAPDGRAVYFTSRVGKHAALYRMALRPNATPEAVTDLGRHVHEGLVSPNGQWLAFRSNSEIWAASMASLPVRDAALQRVSPAGGRAFSFTPDSTGVVYSSGGRVWRQSLAREPIT